VAASRLAHSSNSLASLSRYLPGLACVLEKSYFQSLLRPRYPMKLPVTAACLLLCAPTFAQDIRSYVTTNTVPIATLDATADDYADLAPIGQAIGEARVVMLGEQDHGDGTTFQAKTRLVKYLHERKGFTVLAFESDFYGLTAGWEKLAKQPDSVRHFLQRNVLSHWAHSADCRYLLAQYIPQSFQTSSPLQVSGFDSQLTYPHSRAHLQQDLDSYLVSKGLVSKFPSRAAYQTFLEAVQALVAKDTKPQASRPDLRPTLESGFRLLNQALLAAGDSSVWPRVLASLQAYLDATWDTQEPRDKAMADNLAFLLTQPYKAAKIIVWAANTHVMKHTDQITSKAKYFNRVIWHNMGTSFVQDPRWTKQTYVVGFASYQGTAGRLGTATYPMQVPDKKGLETWVPARIAYGFLDFTPYNQQFHNPATPFLLKSPFHYTIPARVAPIAWNLVYDGLFFIRDMKATTKTE
jgi:erythromycin esterase